jgi:predicted DNA-binding transcriptional regulator AlpA
MNQQSILYVPDLARMLGRTESAIRMAVNRGAPWLPPSFPMGRRLAWRREDVDKFMADQAKNTRR